jgi:predicted lipoprotein
VERRSTALLKLLSGASIDAQVIRKESAVVQGPPALELLLYGDGKPAARLGRCSCKATCRRTGQRDFYANMNNQVLHCAKQGVTINEIQNVYEIPKGLQEKWFCRGYHGSPGHNRLSVIQRYLRRIWWRHRAIASDGKS